MASIVLFSLSFSITFETNCHHSEQVCAYLFFGKIHKWTGEIYFNGKK